MKRRNKWNRVAAFLAALILMTLSVCQAVFAGESAGIDPEKLVQLDIDLEASDRIVTVSLYPVGTWDGSTGKYVLTGSFAGSGASLDVRDEAAMRASADQLKAFAGQNGISAAASRTTEQGKTTFENLPHGLYLVCQNRGSSDNATMTSFLVTLPILDAETHQWNYRVDSRPKSEKDSTDRPGGGDGGSSGGGSGPSGGGTTTGGPGVVSTVDPLVIPEEQVPLANLPIFEMLPKTGDTTNLMLWAALMSGSALALAVLFAVGKRMEK